MENMDKGLIVPKWVLIVWTKIPQMPQNLLAHAIDKYEYLIKYIFKIQFCTQKMKQ